MFEVLTTLELFDRVPTRAIRLIDNSNITTNSAKLSHCLVVADFSLLYRHVHGICSCKPSSIKSQLVKPDTVELHISSTI